jgi:hypothetical protein
MPTMTNTRNDLVRQASAIVDRYDGGTFEQQAAANAALRALAAAKFGDFALAEEDLRLAEEWLGADKQSPREEP